MKHKLFHHLHHQNRGGLLAGLGFEGAAPFGVRFDVDPDGGDGGQGGSAGGSGGGQSVVTMSQASMDALIRDAKAQAKRSALASITDKYGDLDALKAKADNTDGAEAAEALTTLAKTMGLEVGDTPTPKDILAKATERVQTLTQAETKAAESALLDVRRQALKDAKLNPDLAPVLALKGTTKEELATEIEALKPVVGAMGQGGLGGQAALGGQGGTGGIGTGGNPAGAGAGQPVGLQDAVGAHYGK